MIKTTNRQRAIREQLNNEQKRFVRAHARTMYVRQMAERLKVPYSRVYFFMNGENIPIKVERHCSKLTTKTDKRSKEGVFNVFERENWLI